MITSDKAPPHAQGYEVEKLLKREYERGRKDGIAFEKRQQHADAHPLERIAMSILYGRI